LKLAEPVELNHRIQIACLPFDFPTGYPVTDSNQKNVTDVFAVGWGQIEAYEKVVAKRLKNVKLRLYSFDLCSATSNLTNRYTQICAGDLVNNMVYKIGGYLGYSLERYEK
jgi:hypothetical protein